MKVQEYLRSGKTLQNLVEEFNILLKFHNELPLVIMNYDQLESPRNHPIIKECRGLTLRTDNFDLVARSFYRFFDLEDQEAYKKFNFNNFITQNKEDGSLVVLYYFDGSWRANTRGSFGNEIVRNHKITWEAAIKKAFNTDDLNTLDPYLDKACSYVFEFCSPVNFNFRTYEEYKVYLLSVFKGYDELNWEEVVNLNLPFETVKSHKFNSLKELKDFIYETSKQDPSFEGLVIRDDNNNRLKVKSDSYLGLVGLKNDLGDMKKGKINSYRPRNIFPFIKINSDLVLEHHPDVKEDYFKFKKIYLDMIQEMKYHWKNAKEEQDKKMFALKVKDCKLSSILFRAKSNNEDPLMLVHDYDNLIVKHLK